MDLIGPISIILGLIYISQADDTADTRVQSHFAQRCRQYSVDAVSYDNLSRDISTFSDYSSYVFNTLITTKDKKFFCEEEQPKLKAGMKQLTHSLYHCLPREERYLKDFIYDSFKEFLEFLCKDNGHNIDNILSSQGKGCFNSLEQRGGHQEVTNCFNKIFVSSRGVVKKQDLCDDIDVAKKCFSRTLEHNCPDFRSFQHLNEKFFRAISKPCSACTIFGISNLILVISAFFLHKFF